jgi:transposase
MGQDARVVRPDRSQPRWDLIDLEAMLPADHRARIVWQFVESLDLSDLYSAIKSREGEAGRPAADPAVLMALWLFATIEGVGSARALARLAERDIAYRWIAGGVSLNHHGLADFRVIHMELLDRILTESVSALIAEGLVSLNEVAIDGTKVRASASKNSYKTASRLEKIEARAEERLAALKAELENDPAATSRRQQAARERAAQDVTERVAKVREALHKLQKEKAKRAKTHKKDEEKKSEPKASLTDPEAHQMRFADGAVRPGYNAQIAADIKSGVILSIDITDRRNDSGLAVPMVEDIVNRYAQTPKTLLVDSSYATAADIVALASREEASITVFAPLPSEREDVKPETLAKRARARAREPECLKKWRERMASEEGQQIYRRRKLIERINADRKNHGFGFMPVRGLMKAQAIALWHAIAHNLMAAVRLKAQLA